MTYIIIAAILFAAYYGIERYQEGLRLPPEPPPFEPEEIGNLTVKKGDMLECTDSYGEFTAGHEYIVRIEYGGALVVWNDESKPVLAAGLDPRKFKVVAENVDGTAAGKGVGE